MRSEVEKCIFAGPVPDEGHYPTELEGKWRVDDMWIDPKLVIAGRNEEMKCMMKMGVFEVVDEKECHDNGCKRSQAEVVRDWSVERSKGPRKETNNLGQKTYVHPCRRRKG